MDRVTLGRTGLKVSVAGLGAGGASRLGKSRGLTDGQAADLVRAAIDLGIDIIDTAPTYGTEAVVGEALRGRRQQVVLSGKVRANRAGTALDSDDLVGPVEIFASVEESLSRLKTDWLDILHVHGVRPHQYEHTKRVILPALFELRRHGKVRFFGVTEGFGVDQSHTTLQRAIEDHDWDVLMPGLNVLNPSAQRVLLPLANTHNIGVMCMYAVRGALTRPDALRAAVERLIEKNEISREDIADIRPEELLREAGFANSMVDAAYRFCRHTPGVHVVLFGTGNQDHLKANIASINRPKLPAETLAKLAVIFANVVSETADIDSRP